jgi:NADPH2:quinone reductase
MNAVLCKAWGSPATLVVEDLPSPRPGAGEVVVDVKAAGVNFPDVLMIQGKYQVKPPLPFTPGVELAGIVKETGSGVTSARPGDAVVANVAYGAFAEECVVPAASLLPLPRGIDFAAAGGFTVAYGTAWHALKDRGRLRPGETLLVLGAAGGVGLAAVELGAAMGARVIAAASSDEKLAVCRAHGAADTINYSTQDLRERLKAIVGAKGVDVVYDPVGGGSSEPALRSVGWRGRFLVIGFAGGEIPRLPANLPLLKGCAIVGVYWGAWLLQEPEASRREMAELAGWLADGRVRPRVSARYPLARAADAIGALAGRAATGKIVIEPEA